MLDWMTLAIEAIGVVILCLWVVVPIGEFRLIFSRLRQQRTPGSDRADGS